VNTLPSKMNTASISTTVVFWNVHCATCKQNNVCISLAKIIPYLAVTAPEPAVVLANQYLQCK